MSVLYANHSEQSQTEHSKLSLFVSTYTLVASNKQNTFAIVSTGFPDALDDLHAFMNVNSQLHPPQLRGTLTDGNFEG